MLHQNIVNKDTIFINDLIVNTTIGQESWERQMKQPIVINISITTNFSDAIIKNSIFPIIDHKLIFNLIIDFCQINNFNLLESLVTALEQLIISKYSANILALQISAKQLFPATNVKEIGVSIARTYITG